MRATSWPIRLDHMFTAAPWAAFVGLVLVELLVVLALRVGLGAATAVRRRPEQHRKAEHPSAMSVPRF